jgi:enolase
MRMGTETYHHLKKVINTRFGLDATAVGDEGGFAPNILNNKDGKFFLFEIFYYFTMFHAYFIVALDLITTAIEKAGYTGKIEIGMDVAASEFHK